VRNAVVERQVSRRPRQSAPLDVSRCGANNLPVRCQPSVDQSRVGRLAGDADGDIDAFAHEIDVTVFQDQLNFQLGIFRGQVAHDPG
jgi:hypothetical protein